MSSESKIKSELGKISTTFDYDDPFSVSSDLPIPPKMIESSMEVIQEQSETQFNEIQKIVYDMKQARKKLQSIIRVINNQYSYDNFYGVDGGIGLPSATIGGTYSSAAGVAYPANEKSEPYIRVDPIIIPAGLGAPHQNYFEMWMKKYESLVAVEASQTGDCVFLDGTLVPSIFARFLRSAHDYEGLKPDFLTMFEETFVSKSGKKCLSDKLIESKVPIAGLPKRSRSRHIINDRLDWMNLPMSVSDLMACSLLLEPGEYIAPMDYKTIYMAQAAKDGIMSNQKEDYAQFHWDLITKFLRDPDATPKIAGLNESVETIPYLAENTLVTYFKPIPGSIAIRVEILKDQIVNLEKILATIQKDFDKIARIPFCVFMADRYSKSNKHVPTMIKTSIASKLVKIAREKGIVDDNILWYIKELSTSLGSQI
jgi:hypothetical protein